MPERALFYMVKISFEENMGDKTEKKEALKNIGETRGKKIV